jgi:hypothetical protein
VFKLGFIIGMSATKFPHLAVYWDQKAFRLEQGAVHRSAPERRAAHGGVQRHGGNW